jgi:thiamine-phosphate pyrophosphorylase
VILHAIVADAGAARRAARDGATVVQLRIKDAPTSERIRAGREALGSLPDSVMIVINDDVEAAVALGVTVHLGQGDRGVERARAAGIAWGRSANGTDQARRAEAEGALYVGAGPVWETPSKPDAGAALGLEGLAAICAAVRIPVVAIGGIDSGNAAACIRAGAAGVAVIRAVAELRRVRAAVDAARAGTDGATGRTPA